MVLYKNYINDEYIAEKSFSEYLQLYEEGIVLSGNSLESAPQGSVKHNKLSGAFGFNPGIILPQGRGHPIT